MKKEIEITMKLSTKWISNKLSITEAIQYCELAITSYSKSNSFEDAAYTRQYTYCKTMLDLARINRGVLTEVTNHSENYVAFKLTFDTDRGYNLFHRGFVNFTKDCGYVHPGDPD